MPMSGAVLPLLPAPCRNARPAGLAHAATPCAGQEMQDMEDCKRYGAKPGCRQSGYHDPSDPGRCIPALGAARPVAYARKVPVTHCQLAS